MKFFARATLAVLLSSGAGSAHAEPVTKVSHRDRLYDVAGSGGNLIVVGHPGRVLRSSDGGATWETVAAGQHDEALFSIAFNAKGQGAIVGRAGFVLLSQDKGSTFQKSLVTLGDEHPNLFGVAVLPDGALVAVGDFGVIVRSDDQGKTWSRSSYNAALPETPPGQLPAGCSGQGTDNENSDMVQEARLTDVQFVDATRGLVSGEFGLLLETTDGGRTFTRQNTCTDRILYGLAMIDGKHSLAVGANGTAIETTDGGHSWTALPTGTTEHLFGVWADEKRALLVGAAGTVLTRGAGKPLRSVRTGVHSWLISAKLDEQGAGVIVGGRANVLNTSDGGNTQKRILGE